MSWKEIFTTAAKALERDFFCSYSVPLSLAQFVTKLIQMLPEKLLIRFGILSKNGPRNNCYDDERKYREQYRLA